jgi:hypothetical protein
LRADLSRLVVDRRECVSPSLATRAIGFPVSRARGLREREVSRG